MSTNPGQFSSLDSSSSVADVQTFFYSKGPLVDPIFEPADGGLNRACRGASAWDNSASYYKVAYAASVRECQGLCMDSFQCKAFEYSPGRCELWTRKVEATRSASGFHCYRVLRDGSGFTWSLEPVNAAHDSACRGAGPSDNSPSYYNVSFVKTLDECNRWCFSTAGCAGLEFHPNGRCEVWKRAVGSFAAVSGYQCYRMVRVAANGGCNEPPCTCRTAQKGEACYVNTLWAETEGIYYKPEWYPGLTHSSTFEDFQSFLFETNQGSCEQPPCRTSYANDIPTTCRSVWGNEAKDAWSSATCGARIEWCKSDTGGSMEATMAEAKVALEYTACEACWPWPKYKAASDTKISRKRGIAMQNFKLTPEALATLSQSLNWGYIWDHTPTGTWRGGPDLAEWEHYGLNFVPMIWGAAQEQLGRAENEGLPAHKMALLGFNEPNFPDQANLSPSEAAALWPRLQKLAEKAGIDTLVAPAVNFADYDPIKWLTDFLQACGNCKIDAIAFHSYTCYGKYLQDHIAKYKVFNKPLWLTEFACSDASSMERLEAQGQMAYMREAIPLLEQDSSVEMYAWFSYFADDWQYPIVDGRNGDAGLIFPNGSLSELGRLYSSFAAKEPISPPAEVLSVS
eukprot:TRINITY_DN5578_c1_g1_i1.p1 TRINITY_DN5578_c1_g1~~TRINITY_DN5578_c1_g1_i1.p1  ORF type:complete len:722 (-),score=112.54 TRINITY_DN5578_c1_g1_i1:260-2134(-)